MLQLFIGENSFEIDQALRSIVSKFDGQLERFDGEELEVRNLPDIFMGATLFASKRLIVIKDLSLNKSVWDVLPEWIEKTSDDNHVIVIESKPDKRTKTFKDLQKKVSVKEFALWGQYDQKKAESWLIDRAASQDVSLTAAQARLIVARGGLNQWQLAQAIEKLSLLDDISEETIRQSIEATPEANVFLLLETALQGDHERIISEIKILKAADDPYRILGLLSSQVLQLGGLVLGKKPASEVAKDFKVSSYGLPKLAPFAARMSQKQIIEMIKLTAEADHLMKSSTLDPWLHVEQLLIKIARS